MWESDGGRELHMEILDLAPMAKNMDTELVSLDHTAIQTLPLQSAQSDSPVLVRKL